MVRIRTRGRQRIRREQPPDGRNPRLAGAEKKGYDAGVSGVPESECPYEGSLTRAGAPTWSMHYRRAWLRGWARGQSVRHERSKR